MHDIIEMKVGVGDVTLVVGAMGSSYQICPCEVQVRRLRQGWRNLHEHRNFSFLSLDGDPSRSIDLGNLTASP